MAAVCFAPAFRDGSGHLSWNACRPETRITTVFAQYKRPKAGETCKNEKKMYILTSKSVLCDLQKSFTPLQTYDFSVLFFVAFLFLLTTTHRIASIASDSSGKSFVLKRPAKPASCSSRGYSKSASGIAFSGHPKIGNMNWMRPGLGWSVGGSTLHSV